MTILAFDSSAKECSAALWRDGKIIASASLDVGLTHSATLLPLIDSVLARSGTELRGVDLVAVTAGPGSFTGLRIGVATAKGLCWPDNIPVAAIPTTETVARSAASGIPGSGTLAVLMDARRDRFYTASFTFAPDSFARASDDELLTTDEIYEKYRNSDIILTGDGTGLFLSYHGEFLSTPRVAPTAVGTALAAAAMPRGSYSDASRVTATYLRASQAERMRAGGNA